MNFNKVQKRRGIGNVITTLIILIASVVLGAGVIFFGGSMFQTNTQSESMKVSNVHSWVFSGDHDNDPVTLDEDAAATAFVVQNTGSKAVTISSVGLRGVSVPTVLWYYAITDDVTALQTELTPYYDKDLLPLVPGNPGAPLGGWSTETISLSQGQAAIVYLIKDVATGSSPGSMTLIDAGNTYSLQIQAGQATAVQQVQVITAAPTP